MREASMSSSDTPTTDRRLQEDPSSIGLFPPAASSSKMISVKGAALRSVAIIAPFLLSAEVVSSLVFVPSSPSTSYCFLARAHPLRRTAGRDDRDLRPDATRQAQGRRWSLATLVTENPPVSSAAAAVLVTTASEWRRLAGFQSAPTSTTSARNAERGDAERNDRPDATASRQDDDDDRATLRSHLSATAEAGAERNEAKDIQRIQQQARAVAQKHTRAQLAVQRQLHSATAATSSPAGGGGRGATIQLKKPLVTHVFSTPAVASRRRSYRSPSQSTGGDNLSAPPQQQQQQQQTTVKAPIEHAAAEPPVPSEPKSDDGLPDTVQSSVHPTNAPDVPATIAFENESDSLLKTGQRADSHVVVPTHRDPAPARQSGTAAPANTIAPTETTLAAEVGCVAATSKSAGSWKPARPPRPATALSDRIRRLRSQPKSAMVEALLQARYAAIPDVGMRAYQILRDLEMIVPTPDPNDPNYDSSRDDEPAPENNYIR